MFTCAEYLSELNREKENILILSLCILPIVWYFNVAVVIN